MIGIEWMMAGGILLLSLIIFFALINRESYRRHRSTEHYKEQRDEQTLEDTPDEGPEEEDDEEEEEAPSESSGFSIGKLISGIIAMVFFISVLFPVMSSLTSSICSTSANISTSDINASGCQIINNLLPTIIIVGVLAMISTGVYNFFGPASTPDKSPDTRPGAVKHYAGMRDELTRRSTRKSVARRQRARGVTKKRVREEQEDETDES